MEKPEFKLYKTKSRLSSLLVSLSPTNNQQNPHLQSPSYYILVEINKNSNPDEEGYDSIWFDRTNGKIQIKKTKNLKEYDEIGKVYGYIGKFQLNSECSPKLLFIKKCECIGKLKVKSGEHNVYKLKELLILSMSPPGLLNDEFESLASVECDINSINQAPNDQTPITNTQNRSPSPNAQDNNLKPAQTPSSTDSSNNAKFEKKILDEIIKIFQDNNGSFYFSYTYDLTNSIERQQDLAEMPVKLDADDSQKNTGNKLMTDFFWNKILLSDLIDSPEIIESENIRDRFILPLIQGFLQIEIFENKLPNLTKSNKNEDKTGNKQLVTEESVIQLKIALISRRSRYRLGTRFKRRGIDENGNVANFVETEQIIEVYDGHTLSFVILRGSIPVFWSQPGIKYRPAPRIDRNELENKNALKKHFDQLESSYPNHKELVLINLVEEYGKESLLGDAYIEQIAQLSRENVKYIQFDFHEHCKGLKFENVSILIDSIKNILNTQLYSWIDKKGFIFKQKTLFRVNCVDCLDRTNVIQMVLAKCALEDQLARLGFLIPPAELPPEFKKTFSILWANNGDAISQQYAGTSALKSDFTRTGERNFAGIMKDGMKSANRFYLRFKDNYRQMAYEALQGVKIVEENLTASNPNSKSSSSIANSSSQTSISANLTAAEEAAQHEREENVRQLVADCRRQLVDDNEDCYGSWALINYNDSYDPNQLDPDVVLLFTSSALYISNYDEAREAFTDYQKISLSDIEKLEIGGEPNTNQLFKSSTSRFYLFRIYYKISEQQISAAVDQNSPTTTAAGSGYFHTFRSCNLRFFNNLVITTKSSDDLVEALRGICQTIKSTASFFGCDIPFDEMPKLTKKKSKPHPNFVRLARLSTRLSINDAPSIRANSSSSKLNLIGKMLGNKLFGTNSPLNSTPKNNNNNSGSKNTTKPTSLPSTPSSNFFTPQKKDLENQEKDLIDWTVDTREDKEETQDQNGINSKTNLSITEELLSKPSAITALISTIIPVNTNNSNIDNSVYVPYLSQKQYTNRLLKLTDINLMTKTSKTKFVFI